jgi:hypothetical protein
MGTRRSFAAAVTRVIHAPVVVTAAAAALVLLLRLLTDFVSNASVWFSAAVVGAICVPLFILVLIDKHTRSAIDRSRAHLEQRWPSMTLKQRLLFPEEADRLLLFLNRLLWVEATVAMFFDRASFMLGFAGFALTGLLLFLELGNPHEGATKGSS